MENKNQEAETVMNELADGSSFKFTLMKKVKVGSHANAEVISELTVDFDSLTGGDMEVVASLPECNNTNTLIEFSKTYLLHIIARASGVNINILRKLSIADCTALTMKAQAFLMGAVSKAM